MTLIATAITKHGIVHAAVPGLTSFPAHSTAGRRTFRLAFGNAAVAVSGRYEVGAKPLDGWIPEIERSYARTTRRPTVAGFAETIRKDLSAKDDPTHRRMVHLSGYENDGTNSHPVHYFIRNFRGLTRDGGYDKPRREFLATEEFWSRDHLEQQTIENVGSGGAHLYLNGYPEGRVPYLVLNQRMHDLYRQLWNSSDRFRSPRTLRDIATLVDLDMRVTLALLGHGDLQAGIMTTGGVVEIEMVPPPANAVSLSLPSEQKGKKGVRTVRRRSSA
jgi:hypothetical protein